MKKKVLVIVGPTASGKSDLAVRLAKKFNGEIISADSRQVYKGLDVGTGKITKKDTDGIPHHLLDIADPKKQFTVSQYKELGLKTIENIVNKGKLPIVAGGTGLYIDALAGTINFPNVPPNKKLRQKLAKKSALELFKMLQEKDVERATTIDRNNKIRLIRALEIVEAIGKVPPLGNLVSKYKFVYIGLKPNDLDGRIRKRLLVRLESMIREGRKLHSQGLTYKRMHELGLEYRYIAMYLRGKLNKVDMFNKLYKEIRQYSKRQMTWFMRNKKIKWFTLSAVAGFKPKDLKEIEKYVRMALLGLP